MNGRLDGGLPDRARLQLQGLKDNDFNVVGHVTALRPGMILK